MEQCAIYDNKSLNFFRAVAGFLALGAFFLQNEWLVLITAILFLLGVFSMKLNFLYQGYDIVANKMMKQKKSLVEKDPGEIKFVYGFTSVCFFIAFFMIYYGFYTNIGWGLELIVSFLTLLASFANICAAALMYVLFKKCILERCRKVKN